jgi:hypothetical protein
MTLFCLANAISLGGLTLSEAILFGLVLLVMLLLTIAAVLRDSDDTNG